MPKCLNPHPKQRINGRNLIKNKVQAEGEDFILEMIEYISEYKDKMNKENDGGDLSWVNRFINRWAGGDSWTSCDSLVVEWSVAIASTRVQFPVTAFLYPPPFLPHSPPISSI